MDNFNKWFTRFMFGTEIVFLLASMPHIAAWYAHYDLQTDPLSTVYAWVIGYALALALDGVTFMTLFAIMRISKREKFNWWLMLGLVTFMLLIVALSWWINYQYNITFASNEFAKADAITLWHTTIGALNPIIGGAFPVLLLAYTLIGRAVGEDVEKPAFTDEQYERERQRIIRQQELRRLKNTGNGLLSSGKEALLGKGQSAEEKRNTILNAVVDYLRDAVEFIDPKNEERAIQAISAYLKIRSKDVLPFLIAARTTIAKEGQERIKERDTDKLAAIHFDDQAGEEEVNEEEEAAVNDPLAGLTGRDTVSIEQAASILGCQEKHVITLRNNGKLKHQSKNDRLITVASLRQYMATRRTSTRSMPAIQQQSNGGQVAAEQPPTAADRQPPQVALGMIERAMFDAIQKASAQEQDELRELAAARPLNEFTGILQGRYPQYASYITEPRVERVMEAIGVKSLMAVS